MYDLNQIPYDYTVEVRIRFKDLDLIERVPDELWTEVHDIVQETGIKTIPKKKKYKKTQWLYEEALQVAVKRREAKSKGEKKRYTHLNTEFQRIARRDKKAFLSDQCKEIEEGFLTSSCYSCYSLLFFRCLCFSFLLCFLLLFFSQLFVRPPQTAILIFCISFTWGWT